MSWLLSFGLRNWRVASYKRFRENEETNFEAGEGFAIGGAGSGRWPGDGKETTDLYQSVDIRDLRKQGLIGRGDVSLGDVVSLEWTLCNFGGARPWFVCGGCGRRAGILYYLSGSSLDSLRCRVCRDLVYRSQRETRLDRALRKYRKTRKRAEARLGEDLEKPEGMHQATYLKIVGELLRVRDEYQSHHREFLAEVSESYARRPPGTR